MSSEEKKLIAGIDLVGQFSSILSKLKYAIVILGNDKIEYENNVVTLPQLIRILWDYKPDKLAVDNIFELGGTEGRVLKTLSLLPPETEVVQVTIVDGNFIDIKELARKAGILLPHGKPSPLRTAYLCAMLANMGYGSRVKIYERKTKVVVSRGRSPGSGGASSGRYVRNIRGLILRATKEIKEALDKNNIQYDLYVRKSKGGLEGSVFVVYAPREKLTGLIKPKKGHDIVVSIKPLLKSKIEIEGLGGVTQKLSKYVVVGIDPGIETGLAIIDLEFKPLLIVSRKSLDREEIINLIMHHGLPVMIATDKSPPPDSVKKIAATLNVDLFIPNESLSVEEKEGLIDWLRNNFNYKFTISTTHERDALAASIKALRSFESKFSHIKSKLDNLNIDIPLEEIKYLVIKGRSISEAFEEIIAKTLDMEKHLSIPSSFTKKIISNAELELRNRVKSLENELRELIRERETLRLKVKELERKVCELREELNLRTSKEMEKVRSEREIQALINRYNTLATYTRKLETEIGSLRDSIKRMTDLMEHIFKGQIIIVRKIPTLRKEHIYTTISDLGKLRKDEIIYISNLNNIDEEALKLIKEVNAIISSSNINKYVRSYLVNNLIPVIDIKEDIITELDKVVLVKNEHLKEKISLALNEVSKLKEQRESTLTEAKLIELIKSYREEVTHSMIKVKDKD